jgi:YHS domain-containing protein
MKRVFFLLLIVAIGATLIMCSCEQKPEATTDEATQEATETVVADTAVADTVVADTAKVACAGCGMEMEKAQMVSHEIDGETHYFCSEKCKESYLVKKEEEAKKEM